MRKPLTFSYQEYREALEKISKLEKQVAIMSEKIDRLSAERKKPELKTIA